MNKPNDIFQGRQVEIGTLVLCIAATAALYFLGIEPMRTGYEQHQQHQQQLSARKIEDHKLLATRRTLSQTLSKTELELRDSPLHLRSHDEINARVAQINDLATRTGAAIEEIRLDTPSDFPRYRTVPIHLVGRGNYGMFVALLARIVQAFPDTAVSSMELLGDAGRTDTPPRFEVQLVWYASSAPATSLARKTE